MIKALVLLVAMHGTVDQIDGGMALVEFRHDRWALVHVSDLPANTIEGDAVRVPRRSFWR